MESGAILTINGNLASHNGTEGTNTITATATDAAGNTAIWTKTRMVDTDLLPDYYELNITGTDPLDGDSDSSLTPENEAANGITDDMETFGFDDLPTLINMRIGTNPLKEDTDADGLTDEFELLKLGLLTDPTSGTTDGIPDAAADIQSAQFPPTSFSSPYTINSSPFTGACASIPTSSLIQSAKSCVCSPCIPNTLFPSNCTMPECGTDTYLLLNRH